eukprot:6010537-Prymnesium_polylepis.1
MPQPLRRGRLGSLRVNSRRAAPSREWAQPSSGQSSSCCVPQGAITPERHATNPSGHPCGDGGGDGGDGGGGSGGDGGGGGGGGDGGDGGGGGSGDVGVGPGPGAGPGAGPLAAQPERSLSAAGHSTF